MKKVICTLAVVVCLLLTATAVFAEETDTQTGLIPINDAMYYEPQSGMYIFPLAGGVQIAASVADGMMVTGPVTIALPNGVSAQLYRNGKQVTDMDWNAISRTGSYVLSVYDNTTQSVEPLSFLIVGDLTGAATTYTVPDGFAFTQALCDGEELTYTDRSVDLTQEGKYELTYQCLAAGVDYSLQITVDHTAPTLKLEGVVDGVAKGPVDISDVEPDAKIRITLDKKEIPFANELKTSGHYVILLEDAAGNTAQYEFEIQVYFNFSSILLVILLLAVAVIIIAYLVYSRKKARIR